MNPISNGTPFSPPTQAAEKSVGWSLFRNLRRILRANPASRVRANRITKGRSRVGEPEVEKGITDRTGWKVAFACVAGTRHVSHNLPCDDAAGSFVAGQLLGVAMADGAGSASRGGLGASLAVRAALASIQYRYLNGDPTNEEAAPAILRSAFRCAVKSLIDEAVRSTVAPRDLACTLMVVVSDGRFVAAGQVGDGAVVIRDASSELYTLSAPSNGEFANETPMLGCGDFADVGISIVAQRAIREVAVCTDGIQRLALTMPAATPHAGFFVPLFGGIGGMTEVAAEKALTTFLQSPRVAARTDDDKSLLVAQIVTR